MSKKTKHYLFIGDCTKSRAKLAKLPLIDLVITSPPYFNAPFDYKELYTNYESFLTMIANFACIFFYKLKMGAIIALNIDDMLIKGIKYPIISDTIKIFRNTGFNLRGRIIWRKPEGYIRISRRSGVLLQNPYPMYYYPDNLLESIIIFQKNNVEASENVNTLLEEDIWEITNVLPIKGRLENNIAAFPEELPKKLIKTFSTKKSLICDPFLGSGTTMKIARELKRNSIGIEQNIDLKHIILKKVGFSKEGLQNYFDHDELIIDTIIINKDSEEKCKTVKQTNHSLLHYVLDDGSFQKNEYKYHLIILDLRNENNEYLDERISAILNHLHHGRILIIYYDPLGDMNKRITLNHLTDFILKHRIRLRDKITVQHNAENQWNILTKFQTKVYFNHNYYEILIFQKGKFNYKSKSKEEKHSCIINKSQFQKEKWFLSIWEFKKLERQICDEIVTSRLVELFLYNKEVIMSNLDKIVCSKREFEFQPLNKV